MSRVLGDFERHWHLAREIRHADGQIHYFDGTATFTPGPEVLHYEERGTLRAGSAAFEAQQRYTWAPDLAVHFADGRFFHRVPPEGGETSHWCDPDQYNGQYDFAAWPTWTVTWRVRGPRKNYTSHTRLWR